MSKYPNVTPKRIYSTISAADSSFMTPEELVESSAPRNINEMKFIVLFPLEIGFKNSIIWYVKNVKIFRHLGVS